jgi:hypothetical protein
MTIALTGRYEISVSSTTISRFLSASFLDVGIEVNSLLFTYSFRLKTFQPEESVDLDKLKSIIELIIVADNPAFERWCILQGFQVPNNGERIFRLLVNRIAWT